MKLWIYNSLFLRRLPILCGSCLLVIIAVSLANTKPPTGERLAARINSPYAQWISPYARAARHVRKMYDKTVEVQPRDNIQCRLIDVRATTPPRSHNDDLAQTR
jgi:hypothetical protein